MHTLAIIFTYYLFSMILHSQNSKLNFIGFSCLILSTFFFNDSVALFYILCFSFIFIYKFVILFKNYPQKFKSFHLFFISPDLYFAKQEKYILENQHDTKEILLMPEIFNIRPSDKYKSKSIISWNNRNLYFSIFLFIISFIFFQKNNSNIDFVKIFLIFSICRVFSRSIELIFAFYLDIIDSKRKNSDLNSNKRIILASKSYIEIIFNFATLNFLASLMYTEINSNLITLFRINSDEKTILMNPFDIWLKSFGTTTLSDATVDSFFSALQVLTSLVLVLFALAGYLNNKGDSK